MKRKTIFFFSVAVLCLTANQSFSQITEQCAANAGGVDTICYNEPYLLLNAPGNPVYNVPPNPEWTVVSTPAGVALSDVEIQDDTQMETKALYVGPQNDWPDGDYTFQFCVDCFDANGDGNIFQACNTVTHVVRPDVTVPVITNLDGTPPVDIVGCKEVSFLVNPPNAAAGEWVVTGYTPFDNLIEMAYDPETEVWHIKRKNKVSNSQGDCYYNLSFSITNGGCVETATVEVKFISPRDDDDDGIIKGSVQNGCPSCDNRLDLRGDRPGCDAKGYWEVVDGPPGYTATLVSQNPSGGDAVFDVFPPGAYTLEYTIEDNAPCPPSVYTLECVVLDTQRLYIGADQLYLTCEETLPAGAYHFSFLDIPNTVYEWKNSSQVPISFSDPHNHESDVIFANPVDLLTYGPLVVSVYAYRYYLDPDCEEGPLPYTVIPLPYTDPEDNWLYIQGILASGGCILKCEDIALIIFRGSPQIILESESVNFLCSDGLEYVALNDFYTIQGGGGSLNESANVLEQPATSNLPPSVGVSNLLTLNGTGKYVFEIIADWSDESVTPPFVCSTSDILTIWIQEPPSINAGSDQVKCYNEPILLNGNDPYNGQINGVWTQVNCAPDCDITIHNPNDRNTQIFLTGIDFQNDLPLTLYFEWSFPSQDTFCNLSDITEVTIQPCTVPCDSLGIYVETVCEDGSITLTARYANGALVDPAVYVVYWNIEGEEFTDVHTVTIDDPGQPVEYFLSVFLVVGDIALCVNDVTGTVQCEQPPSGCGITIIESCDPCGNVVVTAVDENGVPIVPTNYLHEFIWWVYGGPDDQGGGVQHPDENPITVHPNACYSLFYERYYYPPGVPWQVPGMQDSICKLNLPFTCVSIECPGECAEFPTFMVAGYGDDLHQSLNLPFPQGSHSVCNAGSSGTLGVFLNNLPVDPNLYNIEWENGATGPYVTANLMYIDIVRVTSKDSCCFWEDRYVPNCMCTDVPDNIYCRQPIIRYCHPDGSVTYQYQPIELTWYGVAGATSYELEFTFNDTEGCCESPPSTQPVYITVSASPWQIPEDWDCFTVRIRALDPEGTCKATEWSGPYIYCEATMVCSPYIITCGCCHGGLTGDYAHLPVMMLSESEVLALLSEGSAKEAPVEKHRPLAETPQATFSVFPNPAGHTLFIQSGLPAEASFTYQLFDLLQRPVMEGRASGGQDAELDIRMLPAGVYILRIRDGSAVFEQVEKIVVAR